MLATALTTLWLSAAPPLTPAAAPPSQAKTQRRPEQTHPGAKASTATVEQPPPPPPSDAECGLLPPLKSPWSFAPGERLDFALDALGAQAGTMSMSVLPLKDGLLPVEVQAQTNTFFAKIRRVKGTATSYLVPKTLRPSRYTEDATENEVRRTVDVGFRPREHSAQLHFTVGTSAGQGRLAYGAEGLDVAGAIFLMRQLPLKAGLPVCFDVYGIRRMWRMSGKVEAREHVSLPLGEFEAWHLSGEAVRLDDHRARREVHVWITDDARRLPVAAMGAIDLGVVRATLTGFSRQNEKKRAQGSETLKW